MQIGALSFKPYIYNTNMLSRNSLSRISGIGDDLQAGKTDFSALTDESLNENPLRRGETLNFVDILGMQMQAGRLNASRIMKSGGETKSLVEPDKIQPAVSAVNKSLKAVEDFKPESGPKEMASMQFDRNLFQMQRAAQAYQMSSMLFA